MLKITQKEYEIEETIQLTQEKEGKEEVIFEYKMQITGEELLKLKDIIFRENDAREVFHIDNEETLKRIESSNEEIADICLKDQKITLKGLAGEYKYTQMIGQIRGYLMGFFMKEQISQYNIPITDLTKVLNNLDKLKSME